MSRHRWAVALIALFHRPEPRHDLRFFEGGDSLEPLSLGLRERIIFAAYDRGDMTSDLIPELFQVCRASVNRLVGGFGRPAWLEPTPHGAGKPRKLSSGGEKPLPAVPKLTPGNILVLDLGAHNREGALRRIAAGARARPPAVRSGVLLVEGVGIPEELRSTPRGDLGRYHGAPIELVTAADARGWFAHHAYSIQPK